MFDITRRPTPDDGFEKTGREVEVACEDPPKVPRTPVTVTLDKPNGPILGPKLELLP